MNGIVHNPRRFIGYYENQVGGSLPGFAGAPVNYGRGIGAVFSRLFRFVTPLLKTGFSIVKPHLKSAVKNIASDVIDHTGKKIRGVLAGGTQDGTGGLTVLSRKPRKRPPGQRVASSGKKRRRSGKKTSFRRNLTKRRLNDGDIF